MTTVPALIGEDKCPFDWDGDNPPKELSGGRIIYTMPLTYAYGFFNGDRLVHVLVLAKRHVTINEYMTGNIWIEVGLTWLYILGRYGREDEGFTISINVGYLGGQRIDDPHGHGVPRQLGRPSTGLGLKTLAERFDGLIAVVKETAEIVPANVRDKLLQAIAEATKL